MKRTDITSLFPDATDEQINQLMNLNGADINKAKEGVTSLQTQLTAAQAEVARLKNGPPASDDLQQQLAAVQNELNGMKQAETLRVMREKVAGEKKVPSSLLTGETEEACAQQADEILAFAQGQGYPSLPDGGDPHPPAPKTATREQFAAWAAENL